MNKTLINTALGVALALPALAGAYSEDTRSSADDSHNDGHSTFHYELVRTLAVGAGYSVADAQLIADASDATDSFPSMRNTQLCSDITNSDTLNEDERLHILGTVRSQTDDPQIGEQSPYFHWPRRPATALSGESYTADAANGIDAETCGYFGAACTYEVQQMEDWVFNANDQAFADTPVATPCAAMPGGTYQTVPAGGLIALGIYLHGLGDSYSHQACMATGARTHEDSTTAVCDARSWHLEEEYGTDADGSADGAGTPFTRQGALAIWDALNWYGIYAVAPEGDAPTPASSRDLNLDAFIDSFVSAETSAVRSCIAVGFYQQLLQEPGSAYRRTIAADCMASETTTRSRRRN